MTKSAKARPQPPRTRTPKPATQVEPAPATANEPARFIFKPEVLDRVGVSYVSIWQWMRQGKFPRTREVGPGRVAWLESEIDEWFASRPVRRLKNEEVA